jgi:hypothetical protein
MSVPERRTSMKFLLMIVSDEKVDAPRTPEEGMRMVARYRQYGEDLAKGGNLLGGERLRPEADATRVSNRHGKRVVVDGPFAETKEALGGYFLIECASKQEAIEWAARCPGADHGTMDVRPIWEM